jgi:hypothetical protein
VFGLQSATGAIVKNLQALAPHLPLNRWFLEIVRQGTGRDFSPADNANGLPATAPSWKPSSTPATSWRWPASTAAS